MKTYADIIKQEFVDGFEIVEIRVGAKIGELYHRNEYDRAEEIMTAWELIKKECGPDAIIDPPLKHKE